MPASAIRSPPRIPAAAAGPPFVVFSTSKPSFTGKSSASLSQPLTGHVSTPRNARCTRPSVIRSLAIFLAVCIDERPAGIAAVDGRVSLNGFVDESSLACLHRASERANHASCERGLKSEGIADSKNFLANLKRAGISKRQRDEVLSFGIDFYERNIIALVGADEFCRITRLIAKHHFDGLRALDRKS